MGGHLKRAAGMKGKVYNEALKQYQVELLCQKNTHAVWPLSLSFLFALAAFSLQSRSLWFSVPISALVFGCSWIVLLDWHRPPNTMWDEIVRDHADQIRGVETSVARFLGKRYFWFVTTLMECMLRVLPLQWCDEVVGIARQTGVSIGCLGFMQIVYEFAAACTSIVVAKDTNGGSELLHLRTMDWRMPFDLSPLTVEAQFIRDGRPLYTATTWAGYVGILTGMRHGHGSFSPFSISVNFRGKQASKPDGDGWLSKISALVGGRLVGQLVRQVLEQGPEEFASVARLLEETPLLAPCYITLAGCNVHEAVVITRGRRTSLNPRWMIPAHTTHGKHTVQHLHERLYSAHAPGEESRRKVDKMEDVLRKTHVKAPEEEKVTQQGGCTSRFGQACRVLVQANMDDWQVGHGCDVMNSEARVAYAHSQVKLELDACQQERNNSADWWSKLSSKPLTHDSTIYANLMCAASAKYETRVNSHYVGKFSMTLAELQAARG